MLLGNFEGQKPPTLRKGRPAFAVAAALRALSAWTADCPTPAADRHSTPPPATCGEAIEVQERALVAEPGQVDRTLTPVAQMSTQSPKLENHAAAPAESTAPTVTMPLFLLPSVPQPVRAGEVVQASTVSLPAARA